MPEKKPALYLRLKKRYPGYISSVEALGESVRSAGPLDEKTVQLLQLAAARSSHREVRQTARFHLKLRRC